MKKRISFILVFMLMIICLPGCQNSNKKQSEAFGDFFKNTNEPTIEVVKSESPTATPTIAPAQKIAGEPVNEWGTAYSMTSLFYKQPYSVETVAFYDDSTVVVNGFDYSSVKQCIRLVDIYTGKVKAERLIDNSGYSTAVRVCANGNLILSGYEGNTSVVLDGTLKDVYSTSTNELYYSMVFSKDGNYMYYINGENENLFCYDFKAKTDTLIAKKPEHLNSFSFNSITDDGQHLLGFYYDKEDNYGSVILTIQGKEPPIIEYYETGMDNLLISGNQFYVTSYEYNRRGTFDLYELGKPNISKHFILDSKEEHDNYVYDATHSIVLSQRTNTLYDDKEEAFRVKLYDMERADAIKELTLDKATLKRLMQIGEVGKSDVEDNYKFSMSGGMLTASNISPDGTKALIHISIGEQDEIILWEFEKQEEQIVASEENRIAAFKQDRISEHTNNEKRDELQEKYGLTIFLRNEAVKYFPDFAVNPLLDEEIIAKSLESLQNVLSRYPDGFFYGFNYGSVKGMQVYLCSTLVQGSEQGISNPGGFALQWKDYQVIVLDSSSGTIDYTFNHEVMHGIDNKISDMLSTSQITYDEYNEYETYNPKGFTYHYAYVDENGGEFMDDTKYTDVDPKSVDNPNNIYFIDYYSKTFVIEDRARVFEYIMGEADYLKDAYKSEHIQKKANWIFDMIRKAWPEIPKTQELYWEARLDMVMPVVN